ncbi:MAG: hypothetical protein J6A19_08175 [Oscillospiraceae bacterium]|nr:hypothetical protein [Oscillospiraceae bacterium]
MEKVVMESPYYQDGLSAALPKLPKIDFSPAPAASCNGAGENYINTNSPALSRAFFMQEIQLGGLNRI